MEEWKFIKAGEIFSNISNKKHDGQLEVLSVTQDRGIIPRSQVDIDIKYNKENTINYKKVEKGNFVISLRSFQGGIEYSEYNGIVSPAYTVLSAKKEICDYYYKAFFKSSEYIQKLNIAVYGIRDGKNISYDDFSFIHIPFPPIEEQTAIAEILSTQDKLIELKQKLIEQKKQQKKWLMQNLLTGKIRLKGFEGEWKKISFFELFEEYSRYTNNSEKYPLFSLTIENGVTEKPEQYERSHLVKKDNNYKIVMPNEFVYNPMNIRFGAVARNKMSFPVIVSGYYDIFVAKYDSDNCFFDNYLVSYDMINYYNKVSTGSLNEKKRVHFSQFINFKLVLPDVKERKAIAEILSAQDKEIELLEKELEQEKLKKKALMQLLLTGKVRAI